MITKIYTQAQKSKRYNERHKYEKGIKAKLERIFNPMKYRKRDMAKYYKKPGFFNQQCREYSYTLKGRYGFGKRKAKRQELIWDITREQHAELLNRPCYYCSVSLLDEMGVGLDRIDNNKGYILSNVLPCCGNCNKTRGDRFSIEEMKLMITTLLDFRNRNLITNGAVKQ